MKIKCWKCKQEVKGRMVDHFKKNHPEVRLEALVPNNTSLDMYDTLKKDGTNKIGEVS